MREQTIELAILHVPEEYMDEFEYTPVVGRIEALHIHPSLGVLSGIYVRLINGLPVSYAVEWQASLGWVICSLGQ